MRDDEPSKWTFLKIAGLACAGWVLLKSAVIGYYPDEVPLQLILPSIVACGLLALDHYRQRNSS